MFRLFHITTVVTLIIVYSNQKFLFLPLAFRNFLQCPVLTQKHFPCLVNLIALQIFQRRIDGKTDFYRDWQSYKYGFGSPDYGNDVWLGNEQLYYLTNQKEYKLRIEIVDSKGAPSYAEYERFRLGNESTQYLLTDLGEMNGTTAC